MRLHSVGEGWLIALEQLRANKARSALTVLGVVIGIATVMAMASIVSGFRQQIVQTLEVVGPTTFRVLRFFSQTPVNPDALPQEIALGLGLTVGVLFGVYPATRAARLDPIAALRAE